MIDTSVYDPLSPKRIEDIVGNTDLWKRTASLIAENNSTHLVLVGPPGCGKSLFLRIALAKFLVLTIDCTANFGLRDVRDNIRHFARGGRVGGNLRWVIFEHADSLTSDTQAFLRRMLETTSATTRIVFECRDAGAISEPVLSRAAMVHAYSPDKTEARYEILRRSQNKLTLEDAETLVNSSDGNLRSMILKMLAFVHCQDSRCMEDDTILKDLLSKKPTNQNDLYEWSLATEADCRTHGIDLRQVLLRGWPNNPIVTQTCSLWSRLGGVSGRALYFSCIAQVSGLA